MKKVLFSRTTLFIVFALAAVALMGTTVGKPAASDLHRTAKDLTAGNNAEMASLAQTRPEAILRANVIK